MRMGPCDPHPPESHTRRLCLGTGGPCPTTVTNPVFLGVQSSKVITWWRLPWSTELNWSQAKSWGHRGRNRLNGLTLPLCLDSSASWPTHWPTPQPITLHYLCPEELSVGTRNTCVFRSSPLKSLFFSDVSQASLLKAKGRRSLSMDVLFPSFYMSRYCSGTGFVG